MTALSDFSRDEAELFASLPYKVGIWMSYTDDQDGDADDEREAKTLTSGLRQFAKANKDKPLVSQILEESLRRRDRWEQWADQSFNVTLDIQKAVTLLRGKKISPDDLKAFKRVLMEIGTAVAQAANEYGAFDEAESEGFFGKIIGKFSGDESGHPMNVSAAEDSALEKLRQTLREKA